MVRRAACLVMFICLSFGVPASAHADLLDFIWDMTGPQFIGGGYGCTFDFKAKLRRCKSSAGMGALAIKRQLLRSQAKWEPFFTIGGEVLVSTGKNSKDEDSGVVTDYRFGQAWRAAFTPGVSVRSHQLDGGREILHGVGITWDRLIGHDFKPFDKFGIIVTPVEFIFGDYSIAGKVRMYPNSYTADEFGFGERLDYNRPFEAAYGVSFNVLNPLKLFGK